MYGGFIGSSNNSQNRLRNKMCLAEVQRRECILILFETFHFFVEQQEPIGMRTWKELLFGVLRNENFVLFPEITKQIVNDSIMCVHFTKEDETEVSIDFCTKSDTIDN